MRTSSFKESSDSSQSREESTEKTIKTTAKTVSGKTFLTNKNKVTGVQDVISRMKATGKSLKNLTLKKIFISNTDIREGESVEDAEARGLLNKFLGAQVILSGFESNVKATSQTRQSTKITSTITVSYKRILRLPTYVVL